MNLKRIDTNFDFIIIGAGIAGLHLAYLLSKQFPTKSIALFEKQKNQQNRPMTFWDEKIKEEIKVIKKFQAISFNGKQTDLKKYCFFLTDFVVYRKFLLSGLNNVEIIPEKVFKISENKVKTKTKTYSADLIFNSSLDFTHHNKQKILQYFETYEVEFENKINDKVLTFMDFRGSDKSKGQFFYMIPLTQYTAYIQNVQYKDNNFDISIENYADTLHNKIKNKKFISKEKIVLLQPKKNTNLVNGVLNIGQAAYAIKSTTGYGLTNSINYNYQLLDYLTNNSKVEDQKLFYKFLDLIMFKTMQNKPQNLHIIYKNILTSNPESVLKFLDEKASVIEILSIMLKLNFFLFIF